MFCQQMVGTHYALCIDVLGSHFVHSKAVVCGICHDECLRTSAYSRKLVPSCSLQPSKEGGMPRSGALVFGTQVRELLGLMSHPSVARLGTAG